jgi:hypothetical protein
MAHRLGSVYKPLRVLALFFSSSRTHSLFYQNGPREHAMSFSLALFFPKRHLHQSNGLPLAFLSQNRSDMRGMSFLSPSLPKTLKTWPHVLRSRLSSVPKSSLQTAHDLLSSPLSQRTGQEGACPSLAPSSSKKTIMANTCSPFSALLLSPPKKDHQTHRG